MCDWWQQGNKWASIWLKKDLLEVSMDSLEVQVAPDITTMIFLDNHRWGSEEQIERFIDIRDLLSGEESAIGYRVPYSGQKVLPFQTLKKDLISRLLTGCTTIHRWHHVSPKRAIPCWWASLVPRGTWMKKQDMFIGIQGQCQCVLWLLHRSMSCTASAVILTL